MPSSVSSRSSAGRASPASASHAGHPRTSSASSAPHSRHRMHPVSPQDGGCAPPAPPTGSDGVSVTVSPVQFGVTMFATDQAMRPDELARAAEERGFVSMYVPEHTHIPVSRRTAPPSGDAVLPDYYKRAFDPFVALGMAAGATQRLRVGTGICLVAQ